MDHIRYGSQSLRLLARLHVDWFLAPAATVATLFFVAALLHL